MNFRVYKLDRNSYSMMRELGYKPIGTTPKGELNCVRPLGGSYPRFHVYLREDGDILNFSIHLDQKRPSYEGNTAHSGDYNSETVREEVARIKEILYRE